MESGIGGIFSILIKACSVISVGIIPCKPKNLIKLNQLVLKKVRKWNNSLHVKLSNLQNYSRHSATAKLSSLISFNHIQPPSSFLLSKVMLKEFYRAEQEARILSYLVSILLPVSHMIRLLLVHFGISLGHRSNWLQKMSFLAVIMTCFRFTLRPCEFLTAI